MYYELTPREIVSMVERRAAEDFGGIRRYAPKEDCERVALQASQRPPLQKELPQAAQELLYAHARRFLEYVAQEVEGYDDASETLYDGGAWFNRSILAGMLAGTAGAGLAIYQGAAIHAPTLAIGIGGFAGIAWLALETLPMLISPLGTAVCMLTSERAQIMNARRNIRTLRRTTLDELTRIVRKERSASICHW